MKSPDLTNRVFDRLTVRFRVYDSRDGILKWNCLCECGNKHLVPSSALTLGRVKSCGCLHREMTRGVNFKHGLSKTKDYFAWQKIIERCENPKAPRFKDYGARGIYVCKRWHNFSLFILDMGKRPRGKSLDRRDNSGPYRKSNCRWATPIEQARNSRNNRLITLDGKTFCLKEWSEIVSIPYSIIKDRLALGWPERLAIRSPHIPGKILRKSTAQTAAA